MPHRASHLFCFFQRHGQGFFAEHNLTRSRGCHCDGRMQCVRNRYIDNLNVLSLNDCAPICGYLFPSPLQSHCFQLLPIASADNLQLGLIGSLKKMAYLMESIGMYLPDEAMSDHGNIQRLFGLWHYLCSVESGEYTKSN